MRADCGGIQAHLDTCIKKYLAQTYGKELGKASVTGYCIKFKTLKDTNIDILEAAIRYGIEQKNI